MPKCANNFISTFRSHINGTSFSTEYSRSFSCVFHSLDTQAFSLTMRPKISAATIMQNGVYQHIMQDGVYQHNTNTVLRQFPPTSIKNNNYNNTHKDDKCASLSSFSFFASSKRNWGKHYQNYNCMRVWIFLSIYNYNIGLIGGHCTKRRLNLYAICWSRTHNYMAEGHVHYQLS